MVYEDMISQQYEIQIYEESIIGQSHESNIKDYNTAMQKIKNLFAVRKILEKRKLHDEKIINGLNNGNDRKI